MDFFGIGPLELLLILVVALIIFGPAKLPEIGRNVGKALLEFRRTTDEIRDTVLKEVEVEEMRKAAQSVKDSVQSIKDPVQEIRTSLSLEPPVKPPTELPGVPRSPSPAQGEAPPSPEQGKEKP